MCFYCAFLCLFVLIFFFSFLWPRDGQNYQSGEDCGSNGDMYHGYASTLYAMLCYYALSRWDLLCFITPALVTTTHALPIHVNDVITLCMLSHMSWYKLMVYCDSYHRQLWGKLLKLCPLPTIVHRTR